MFEVVQIATPTGKTDDVLKINNTSSSEISYTFGDILEIDSEYTFSCWMRGETNTNTEIHISTKFDTFDLTSSWTRVIFTAASNIVTSKEVRFTIPVGATIYAYQGQLELGNKATDFGTNPEDVVDSITDVNEKVVVLQTNFNVQQGQIDALIKETTIDGGSIKDKFTQMEATIDGIQTSVGDVQTDVDGMESRLTEVEITADGVSSTVSANKDKWDKASTDAESAMTIANQTADKFSWIVKGGTNETDFTLTDRTAQLVAENINLKGLVTFSGLNTETQEKINTAQETAESANETATEANENVNGVKTIVDQWASDAVNGETTINGGYLKTHTIKSVHLDVNEILAEDGTFMGILQATEINADRITSGTIKANILDVYGLTVRQKDTEIETFKIDGDGDITMRGNVESYNYVSGTSGWSIKSNGDAEFNDVTVRGNLIGDAGGILDVEIDDVLRPVFWAGETYDQRDYAPFIVYNDGSIKATKGTYSGIWTGDIKVGNISIADPSSSAGSDAIVTIQDGNNGIKKVELTDSDNSYFSQGIQIRDNFYNTNITLSQSGIIQTNNSVLVQNSNSSTQITPTQISLNGAIVSGQTNSLSLQTNEVYVDNKSGGGNLTVYGDVFANSRAVVKKELSFNEGIKCTVSTNGIDFTSDIVYTVTFVSNGGTEVSPQTIRYGGYAQRPPDPVRAGYVFNGWYTNTNFTNLWSFSMNTVTDNVTLYAEWLNTPQAPTVVVQQYQVGNNIGGTGRYVRVGCVVTATVDNDDRLGELSYQWDLKVYNFVDTVVANFTVPASENVIDAGQLNAYIGTSSDSSSEYFTVKGTCKVVNTLNGMPVWTTVDIYEIPYQETEAVIDAYTLTDNDNSILTDNDNNTLTD